MVFAFSSRIQQRIDAGLTRLAIAVFVSTLLVACGKPDTGGLDGRAIYDRHCAPCHGNHLEGQPEWRQRRADGRLPAPPHDDSGHTWHHPMEQLFAIIKFGLVPPNAPAGYASDMPAFGGRLSDEEIRAVLAYIESRWSAEVRRMREERFKR